MEAKQPYSAANIRFAWNLLHNIESKSDNVFISPLSLSLCLAMSANGAVGETRDQILKALSLPTDQLDKIDRDMHDLLVTLLQKGGQVELDIGNSVWCDDLLPDFVKGVKDVFLGEARPLAGKDAINAWVNEKTRGKIPTIINQDPPKDGAALINAIYFKGHWKKPFEADEVREDTFKLGPGKEQKIMLMKKGKEYFNYFEDEWVQVAEFPYKDENFTATFVLPRNSSEATYTNGYQNFGAEKRTPISLDELVSKGTAEHFASWISGLEKKEGYLSFPKFKLEFTTNMTDILKKLGMTRAFDRYNAQFDAMSKVLKYVEGVLHKTLLEVDETGTVAAAVTYMGLAGLAGIGAPPPPPPYFVMKCDHPFLFAIRHIPTDTLLFIGKIANIGEGVGTPVTKAPPPTTSYSYGSGFGYASAGHAVAPTTYGPPGGYRGLSSLGLGSPSFPGSFGGYQGEQVPSGASFLPAGLPGATSTVL